MELYISTDTHPWFRDSICNSANYGEVLNVNFLERSPIAYELAHFMMRHRVRGGARLMSILKATGRLTDRAAIHKLDNGGTIYLPLMEPYGWDKLAVRNYERQLLDVLHKRIAVMAGNVTLIDCGADIGLVTAFLVDQNPQITQVFALEPNPTAYELLRANTQLLETAAETFNVAVSDYIGTASMQSPHYDQSTHARFIVPDPGGEIEVTTIDSLAIRPPRVVIKIDVEGAELNVIRGARATIQAAEAIVIAIEAHPVVAERTGVDPIEVLRTLHDLRPFSLSVAEDASVSIDLSRGFFDQVNPRQGSGVFNVVGISQV